MTLTLSPLITTTFYEGMRLVLASAGVILSIWGLLHKEDGILAFAHPLRPEVCRQRQVRMLGYAFISLMTGLQAIMALMTPNEYVIPFSTFTGQVTIIVALLVLLYLIGSQISSWSKLEETLGDVALELTEEERIQQAVSTGRKIAHLATNELQRMMASLELQEQGEDPTPEQIDDALAHLEEAGRQITSFHLALKALSVSEHVESRATEVQEDEWQRNP